jgi:hypothetical protein
LKENAMHRTKKLLRHARTLWNTPWIPEHIRRHNRKAWVRSVLFLGDKWLLAKPVERMQ